MNEYLTENKNLELKKEYNDSLLKTISAFSNYEGGTILIGVDDDKNIVGIDDIIEVKLMIENKINDTIVPRPNYKINILEIKNKNVIEITVNPEDNTPYLYKGIAYQRKDTSTVPVDQVSLINLSLKGKNLSYDQTPSNHDNFKFLILESYFKRAKEIEKFDKDILITLGLINNKKYTMSAELFSDENNFIASGIDIVRFGQSSSEFIDRKIIEKVSILKQYEEALLMFQKYYLEVDVVEGFNRVKKVQIPQEAFREALANAIVHRDYLINSHIKVSMYDNRIEITSPGGLPIGLNEENYLNVQISIPRNVIVAQVLFMLGIIERFGIGIWRINKSYQNYSLKPKYVIKDNFIKVILPNLLFNDNDMIPEKRIINYLETQLEIRRQDVEKLLEINKSKAVEILNELVDKNLIKLKGNGRSSFYILDNSN